MIEIVRKHTTYQCLGEVYSQLKAGEFKQVNKKDAFGVVQGKHTMSTTKKGNFVPENEEGWFGMKTRAQYSIGHELGRLAVCYHNVMGYTLQEYYGESAQKMDWKQAHDQTIAICRP